MKREYEWKHLVTLAETNLVGNVYFAEYLRWQGNCRETFLFENAPETMALLQQRELGLVTLRASMEYYAEAFAGDTITLLMTMHGQTASQVTMNFEFRRSGLMIATGQQTTAAVRPTNGGPVPIPLPDDLLDALDKYRD